MNSFPRVDRGQPLTARFFTQIIDKLLFYVVGGRGIIVRRMGRNIVIENAAPFFQAASPQSQPGGSLRLYEAANKTALDLITPVENAAAGVTLDDYKLFTYDWTGGAWQGLNTFD